jgi:hypothetical protein
LEKAKDRINKKIGSAKAKNSIAIIIVKWFIDFITENLMHVNKLLYYMYTGADPGFQVRGAHLKNCAERREGNSSDIHVCSLLHFFVCHSLQYKEFCNKSNYLP